MTEKLLQMEPHVLEAVKKALEHPFFKAIENRKSLRFPMGVNLEATYFNFQSPREPVPLSEIEEALLVWAATGIVGQIFSDIDPNKFGPLGTLMHWQRRTWPSPCASHGTQLFFSNDEGIWAMKVWDIDPEDLTVGFAAARTVEEKAEAALEFYHKYRVKISDNRDDLPTGEVTGFWTFNAWNANRPGTTLFIPVSDFTIEYLNILFLFTSPQYQWNMIDELHGGRNCGTDRWLKSGLIKDDVPLPLAATERLVATLIASEQAFAMQNASLAAVGMGLGGWLFGGHIPMAVMGGTPQWKGLGFKFVTAEKGDFPLPYPIGREDVLKTLHPYWHNGDIEQIVDVFNEMKWKKYDPSVPKPFKAPDQVMCHVPPPTKDEVRCVKDILRYIWDTYGRFPATVDPCSTALFYQAHHLELEFYDKFYPAGSYSPLHEKHFELWHPEMKDPFKK